MFILNGHPNWHQFTHTKKSFEVFFSNRLSDIEKCIMFTEHNNLKKKNHSDT